MSDGTSLYIPGAPQFVVGEHVLLHLAAWGEGGTYRLNSWSEGVLREREGLAYLGADGFALNAWSCNGEHIASGALDQHDFETGLDGQVLSKPLTWDSAVSIVVDCIGEAGQ